MRALGRLFDIVAGVVPVDLQAAQSGDYISLKNAAGVAVVFIKAAGTDGDDPMLTVRQAQSVGGTNAKDFDPAHGAAGITAFFKKEGTLTAVGSWTKVEQTAAATVAPGDPSAQSQGIYVFEIMADELDRANLFDCVAVNVADTGTNAQLGTILYFAHSLIYPSAPEKLLSLITD